MLQANNKLYSDKDGHIKLSDFGLSTGFHKDHDSRYYHRLLATNQSAKGTAQSMRNSVMVNSINLTMTNKDQIATWKANRRKLVCVINWIYDSTFMQFDRLTRLLGHQTTSLRKSFYQRVMEKNAIGGLWGRLCMSA